MNELETLLKQILPNVNQIIVYPNIKKSSAHNPYLSLLYRDLSINAVSGNPLNPFAQLRYSTQKDIVHYHWLEITSFKSLITIIIKLTPLLLFRLRGGTLIWTLHNIEPHTKKWLRLNSFIHKNFGAFASKVLVHSEVAKSRVTEKFNFPHEHVAVIPHPRYDVKTPSKHAVEAFKATHSLKRPFVLMFGYIASYKGITEIIKYFSENETPVDLVIAGSTKKGDESYVQNVLNLSSNLDNVHIINQYISHSDEALLFSGAEASLFNFTTILTSGSLMLSYSYDKKIISSSVPSALPEKANYSIFNSHKELKSILEELVQ